MDEKTAWDLFNAGRQISVIINRERFDAVLISGLEPLRASMTLLLRTRIGDPDRHLTVPMDQVELAPDEK